MAYESCGLQIAALEQAASSDEQGTNPHAGGTAQCLEGSSAQQLIDVIKQAAKLLQEFQPDELQGVTFSRNPRAEAVEQLLTSLMPKLQADDFNAWCDAIAQLVGPVNGISKPQTELDSAIAEMEALRQACSSGHKTWLKK